MHIAHILAGLAAFAASDISLANLRSHCHGYEQTIWSCRVGAKHYSVCASPDLVPGTGYLQYRVGRLGKKVFAFPGTSQPPRESFRFRLLAHGASLRFEQLGHAYEIIEDIKGETSILIQTATQSTRIVCTESTGSLTENDTIELMNAIGVSE